MYCSILSAAIYGIEAVPISVEADVSDGFPSFSMVGYVGAQVREAQERVRTALKNIGIRMPPKRITINLSPGDLRKEGTQFDLPIAAAILAAIGRIPEAVLENCMLLGELHLDGRIESVPGVLPCLLKAEEDGCESCIIPASNLKEGQAVRKMQVIGIRSLTDLIDYTRYGVIPDQQDSAEQTVPGDKSRVPDFSELQGQESVKRAAVIAAAGFHNLLLSGPPGSGKSMAARRIPTILPPLTEKERLEISGIYSIAGQLPQGHLLMKERPFRAPHHTISPSALCGGGRIPHPGEITLAHRGVLFLDEFAEMKQPVLELLRQPLEDRKITVSRLDRSFTFPAEFLLVAAVNPCPCGYFPDRNRCICQPGAILRYQQKLSGPVLDRIDIRCDVQEVEYEDLKNSGTDSLSSSEMQKQVIRAAERQRQRYSEEGWLFNSELQAEALGKYCVMTEDAERIMEQAFGNLGLSARGYHRILKLARTIADLDEEDILCSDHILEAIGYRSMERNG